MLTRTIFACAIGAMALFAVQASASQPVVYYTFDELDTTVPDESGNRNDGTPRGGVALDANGQAGKCFAFNGTDAYVELQRPIEDSFAITAWIKTETPGLAGTQAYEGSGIFWSDVSGAANDFVVATLDTKLSFFCGNPDTSVNSNGDVVTGDWVHIAAVRDIDAGTISVYIDGALDNSVSHSNKAALDAQAMLHIGANTLDSRFYEGLIDEVRLYSRALSAEQVNGLYNGIFPSWLKAEKPVPADGAIGVTSPLFQWGNGETALFHNVYFGTNPEPTEADLVAPRQPFNMYYRVQGLQPGVTYYWRIDEIEADMVTVHTGDVWSFTAMPLTAYAPAPADGGTGVAQAPTVSWAPGQGAMGHHVYFGDSYDAVRDGAAETDQGDVAETRFSAGLLRAGTTYYWRVDETDTAGAVQVGEVWSFTTGQPVVGKIVREWWLNNSSVAVAGLTSDPRYPGSPDGSELLDLFEGPTDWSDNYGSRLYGWLVPPESGDYTFWIASDDSSELWLSTDEDPANGVLIASVPTWVPARDFDNTGGGLGDADAQKSDPIALAAGAKYYIEALMNEGGGGDNIAVAWQVSGGTREVIPGEFVSTYALPPLSAAAPSPENGAVDTIQSPVLSWFAGENAVRHHVYFGEDADVVAGADTSSAEYKGQQAGATYNPGALEWGKSYAWRVDEEEADGTVRKGAVWGFTTAAFLLIEDFESYTDNMDDGEAIFQTWIDGWENGTGSTVGYLSSANGTFGETTIIHGGKQSMPLDYNNVNAPYYSETERTFAPPMNLTANGMDTLTLYVRGQGSNDPAMLYVGLESGATRVNAPYGDDTVVQSATWVEVSIPLADLAGVNAAAVGKMYISIGNPDAPTAGGAGLVFIDDIRATKSDPGE